jgi:hypothetical protein
MSLRLPLIVLGLALALAGCSRDCVACGAVGAERDAIQQVVVNLCASEVPDPEEGEGICAEAATVSYRFVAPGQ